MVRPDRPREDVRFFPVDPGAILFCAQSQNLHALNGAAALIWCGLEEGLAEADIAAALVDAGAPVDEAPSWYRRTIEMLRLNGLLLGTQAPASPAVKVGGFGEGALPVQLDEPPRVLRRLALAGLSFDLELSDPLLIKIADRLFHPSADSNAGPAPPGATIRAGAAGGRWVVLRDGLLAEEAASAGEIAGALERGVMRIVLEQADYLMAFRAALLRRDGQGILLAGASGSGKSMLAAGLMHRGWQFGCDEQVLFKPGEAALRPVPKSLRLYRSGWPVLAALFPDLMASPVYGPPNRLLRSLVPTGATIASTPVGHIVFCRYRPQAESALVPLARSEGLQGLFGNCAAVSRPLEGADIEALVGWSEGVDFHRLSAADLAGALHLLERLA